MKPGSLVQDETTHAKLAALVERTPTLRDQFALVFLGRINRDLPTAEAVREAYAMADEALTIREAL